LSCFAIAAPGLEPLVARELSALGEQPRIDEGGVTWDGDARSMMRANLWLRTASRVLVRVARFRATKFYELEASAKRIPWDRYLGNGERVEFRVTARKSKLYHSDAIAERLGTGVGSRGKRTRVRGRVRDDSPQDRTQLFVVRVVRDEFTVSADTSEALLHLRGYRQAVGKAPLRETLAAALLLAAEWKGDAPLVDPFCGSGTIPIEGALIARNMAPGRNRRFAFMRWPSFDARIWEALVADAERGIRPRAAAVILGSDRDEGAIAAARANAMRAGVAGDIEFSVRPISALEPPDEPGLLASNPPYGVRISGKSDVRDVYAQLGNLLRERWSEARVALYAPDARLIRQTRLHTSEAIRTSNGGIRVSAYVGEVREEAL
jgi:putative N6-adenine-specific DNA methylase